MKLPQWLQQFRKDKPSPYFFLPFFLYRVSGQSMQPALHPRDIVLGLVPSLTKLKIGDVLIFRKNRKFIIKRLASTSNGSFQMEGDNFMISIDSRYFGKIEKKEIVGKVIAIFHNHR